MYPAYLRGQAYLEAKAVEGCRWRNSATYWTTAA